jgi:pimeloyl-ACP methyl ester carboxylesterase
MSAVLLDGRTVHYEVIGRGRPIIFLHGWVGSWRYWIPAMLAAFTDFLANALDLWGFGDTARTDRLKADQLALTTSFNSPDLFDLFHRISSLNTPCLLVYGQNDLAVALPNYDKSMAPLSIHSIIFEQSAHFPMLDEPSGFNRLLTDFLALESSESPRELQMKEEWKRRVR